MAPQDKVELKRPADPIYRPRETTRQHKQSQNVRKGIQPNPLLFVNVSDPAESKCQDSRKAVRSFVMKKYKQSQKISESFHLEHMKLDEDTDEIVNNGLELSQVARSADSLSQLWPDNSCDMEEPLITPRQHGFPWLSLAYEGQSSSPMSIIGNGSLDPFDSYPVQIDMPAHELIDMCTCDQS